MDLATIATLSGACGTLIGALGGAVGGWWGRRKAEARATRLEVREERRSEREDEQSAQAAAIAERTALINTITETLLEPLRKEVAELRSRLEGAEAKIDNLEDRNDRLVAFIYRLIGIIRRAGVDHEIVPADVPPGIHL